MEIGCSAKSSFLRHLPFFLDVAPAVVSLFVRNPEALVPPPNGFGPSWDPQ